MERNSTNRPLVVDLGCGNIGSVVRMLTLVGASPEVIDAPPGFLVDVPVILPGVGNFTHAARSLSGPWRTWLNRLHGVDTPILGICLGAQLMCTSSEEGGGEGLGWVDTRVCRFPGLDSRGNALRVPHMGWEPFSPPSGCLPFAAPSGRMYYAHSYFMAPPENAAQAPYQFEYGGLRFAAVIRSRQAIGVQFHPEKSHRHGMEFLRSWMTWAGKEAE